MVEVQSNSFQHMYMHMYITDNVFGHMISNQEIDVHQEINSSCHFRR